MSIDTLMDQPCRKILETIFGNINVVFAGDDLDCQEVLDLLKNSVAIKEMDRFFATHEIPDFIKASMTGRCSTLQCISQSNDYAYMRILTRALLSFPDLQETPALLYSLIGPTVFVCVRRYPYNRSLRITDVDYLNPKGTFINLSKLNIQDIGSLSWETVTNYPEELYKTLLMQGFTSRELQLS